MRPATRRSIGKALLVALCLLTAPSSSPAQPSPPAPHPRRAPARCPRHRPIEGSACTREAAACRYECGVEGDSSFDCTCTRSSDDARLHWHCEEDPLGLCGM